MPGDEINRFEKGEILSFEEIIKVAETGARMGISKVRLTGGEPLVRKNISDLVSMLNKVPGIDEVTMTTNGILLSKVALKLKRAGLNRVNISLDSVSPDIYREITRGGSLETVFEGISAARSAGLLPIKLNVVKLENMPVWHYDEIKKFAEANKLQVRFINQMNLKKGVFSKVDGGEGGNCDVCNRFRLTANGYLKPCLFSDLSYNIRMIGIENAFLLAANNKPLKGTQCNSSNFYNIGG